MSLPQNSLQKGCGLFVAWVSDSKLSISCFVLLSRAMCCCPSSNESPQRSPCILPSESPRLAALFVSGTGAFSELAAPLHSSSLTIKCTPHISRAPVSPKLWLFHLCNLCTSVNQQCLVNHLVTAVSLLIDPLWNECLVLQEILTRVLLLLKNELNCYLLHCCWRCMYIT